MFTEKLRNAIILPQAHVAPCGAELMCTAVLGTRASRNTACASVSRMHVYPAEYSDDDDKVAHLISAFIRGQVYVFVGMALI